MIDFNHAVKMGNVPKRPKPVQLFPNPLALVSRIGSEYTVLTRLNFFFRPSYFHKKVGLLARAGPSREK